MRFLPAVMAVTLCACLVPKPMDPAAAQRRADDAVDAQSGPGTEAIEIDSDCRSFR